MNSVVTTLSNDFRQSDTRKTIFTNNHSIPGFTGFTEKFAQANNGTKIYHLPVAYNQGDKIKMRARPGHSIGNGQGPWYGLTVAVSERRRLPEFM